MTEPLPGEACPTCGRKVPHVHDKPPTQRQSRFSVAVPIGEEGVLDELLIQWQERCEKVWPDEVAALGDKGWRYRALHMGLYTLVMEGAAPAEVGG